LEKKLSEHKKKAKQPTRKYEGLLSDVGTAAGSIFGKKGSMVGKAAGSILGSMFGWGDYESTPGVMYPVQSNTLFGRQLAQQVPLMHSGDGVTRIAHREYCFDVPMSGKFGTGTRHHIITPTNELLFPWLSGVAAKYTQFKVLGMSFGFRGLASNTTQSGSLGSVSLATVYDVRAKYFTSKAQMLGSLFSTSCKPTDTMLHPLECDPSKTPSLPRYTRSNIQEAKVVNDLGLTKTLGESHGYENPADFFGMLTVSAVNNALQPDEHITAGELWVTYDIAFYKPIIGVQEASQQDTESDSVFVPPVPVKTLRR